MKAVVIGGIESSFSNLEALVKAGVDVQMFYTRGKSSPGWGGVKMINESRFSHVKNVPRTIVNGNINEYADEIRKMQPDYGFSFGWQQIFKKELLQAPKYGFIGIHESLLPKGAGAVPLANAILHDFEKTGISLFYLDKGMDTGNLIDQITLPSSPRTATATQLYEECMEAGRTILTRNIPLLENRKAVRIKQNFNERTEYGKINWEDFSAEKVNRARTYPYS